MAEQQIINIGQLPNDGSGDPLRVAFDKTNNNFSTLFKTATFTSNAVTEGLAENQVIFETAANAFSQGLFTIRSKNSGSNYSQSIQLSAQISPDNESVKFTGYATTFFGDPLTSFDMDVTDGNVRILCNPLIDDTVFHFIGAQILPQE